METLACGKWKHWGPFRTSELVRPCLREWRPSSCPSRSHGALGRKSPLKRQGCVFVLGVPTFFVVSKGNQTETVAPFWGSLKQDTPSCCFCPQLLSPFCRLPYLTNIQDVPIFEALAGKNVVIPVLVCCYERSPQGNHPKVGSRHLDRKAKAGTT